MSDNEASKTQTLLQMVDGGSPSGRKLNDRLTLALKIVAAVGVTCTIASAIARFLGRLDGYYWVALALFVSLAIQVWLNFRAIKLRDKIFEYCPMAERKEVVPLRVRKYLAILGWISAICFGIVASVAYIAILFTSFAELPSILYDQSTPDMSLEVAEMYQRRYEELIAQSLTVDRLVETLLLVSPVPILSVLFLGWEFLLLIRSLLTIAGYSQNVKEDFDEASTTDYVTEFQSALESNSDPENQPELPSQDP